MERGEKRKKKSKVVLSKDEYFKSQSSFIFAKMNRNSVYCVVAI